MVIRRDLYLKKLISKKHNGLIKVITGIRRCGKSYLLFNLFKEHLQKSGIDESHISEMAFDSYENKKYRTSSLNSGNVAMRCTCILYPSQSS